MDKLELFFKEWLMPDDKKEESALPGTKKTLGDNSNDGEK